MTDIEKVIKGIEHCLSRYVDGLCDDCPYMGELDKSYMIPMKCKEIIMRDALALLKKQKSLINFLNHQREKGHWIFGDSNGHSWMKCSQCLVSQDGQTACFSFCPNCGASMEEEPERMT